MISNLLNSKVLTTQLNMGAVELVDPSYNLAIGDYGLGLMGEFLEDARDEEQTKLPTAPLFDLHIRGALQTPCKM